MKKSHMNYLNSKYSINIHYFGINLKHNKNLISTKTFCNIFIFLHCQIDLQYFINR